MNLDRSSDHEYLSQFVFKFNNAQMEKRYSKSKHYSLKINIID